MPYRDSKLTRLLANNLGGNSLTAFLCCVAPEARFAGESTSTLQFALTARAVKTSAVENVEVSREELQQMLDAAKLEIAKLRAKIESGEGGGGPGSAAGDDLQDRLDEALAAKDAAERDLRDMTDKYEATVALFEDAIATIQEVQDELAEARQERDEVREALAAKAHEGEVDEATEGEGEGEAGALEGRKKREWRRTLERLSPVVVAAKRAAAGNGARAEGDASDVGEIARLRSELQRQADALNAAEAANEMLLSSLQDRVEAVVDLQEKVDALEDEAGFDESEEVKLRHLKQHAEALQEAKAQLHYKAREHQFERKLLLKKMAHRDARIELLEGQVSTLHKMLDQSRSPLLAAGGGARGVRGQNRRLAELQTGPSARSPAAGAGAEVRESEAHSVAVDGRRKMSVLGALFGESKSAFFSPS